MHAELRTLGRQLRAVRRIDDEIAQVTRPGAPPFAKRLTNLLKLRRIAERAARDMAETIGQTGIDVFIHATTGKAVS